MSDPVGLIGAGGASPLDPRRAIQGPKTPEQGGVSFADVLKQNLNQVNELQQDASRAVEDLVTGKRDDLEGVILATQKADTAFQMLQAMRNKVMDAYEEIKQIRV